MVVGVQVSFLVPIKNIMGQVINFIVPLIVIGFIAPSITKLGSNASRMLGVALVAAYVSSILAALLSMSAGYVIIPGFFITIPEYFKFIQSPFATVGTELSNHCCTTITAIHLCDLLHINAHAFPSFVSCKTLLVKKNNADLFIRKIVPLSDGCDFTLLELGSLFIDLVIYAFFANSKVFCKGFVGVIVQHHNTS